MADSNSLRPSRTVATEMPRLEVPRRHQSETPNRLKSPTPTPDAAASPQLSSASASSSSYWEPEWSYYEPMFDRFARENDPLKCDGYLTVHRVARTPRTLKSAVPEELIKVVESGAEVVTIDPVARAAAELMVQPWSVVRFKTDSADAGTMSSKSSKSPREDRDKGVKAFPELSYDEASDAANPKGTASEQTVLDKDILSFSTGGSVPSPPGMPPRPRLFKVFPMVAPEPILPPQQHGKPLFDRRGVEVLIQFGDFAAEGGELLEPFFAVGFLYDMALEEKITENFYWTPTDRKAANFVLQVERNHPTVYLVVCLMHVIRGDYEEGVDPYCKTLNPKDLGKLKLEIDEAVARLKGYKQVFAWTAVQMFSPEGYLLRTGDLKLNTFVKVKEDLQSFVERMSNERERAKIKGIPITMTCHSQKLERSESKMSFIDPLLLPVTGYDDKRPVAREIMKFATPEDVVVPYLDYVNVLYLYPEILNFNNYKGADSSARNILITVRLFDDDNNLDLARPGLPAMYGENGMETSMRIPLQYHIKRPKFLPMDEIKIKLPHSFTPKHHVIVTFSHVECKAPRKGKVEDPETILGYCVIPLIENGEMVKDDRKVKPVALSLPMGYLKVTGDSEEKRHIVKWVENGKPLFAYRTKLLSTVYTQDPVLIQLNKLNPKEIVRASRLDAPAPAPAAPADDADGEVHLEDLPLHIRALRTIQALERTPVEELTRFFPMVVNKLLQLMTSPDEEVSSNAWKRLIEVVRSVDTEAKKKAIKEPILESFVEFMYKVDSHIKPPVHEVIIKKWIDALILYEKDLEGTRKLAMNYSWFFLGIIFKDMVLTLNNKRILKDHTRQGRFSDELLDRLHKLVLFFSAKVDLLRAEYTMAKELNRSVAFFIRSLFDLLDRGVAFHMAHDYISSIDKSHSFPDLQELKFIALRIFCDHKKYVSLNLPTDEINLGSADDIERGLFQRHFLSGLLLREVKTGLLSAEQYTRVLALTTLRDIISKHDRDNTLGDNDRDRRRIAATYFPFFLTVLELFPGIFPEEKRLDPPEKDEIRQWLICFLYLLKEVDPKLLAQWGKIANKRQEMAYLKLLLRIPETFKYPGKDSCIPGVVYQPMKDETPAVVPSPGPLRASDAGDGSLRMFAKNKKERLANVSRADTKNMLEDRYGVNSSPQERRTSIAITANPLSAVKQEILLPMYKYLGYESSRVVLERIFMFITDHKDIKGESPESIEMFQATFDVLIPLSGRDQCHEFLAMFFYTLQSYLKGFKKHVFKLQTTVCQSLTLKVMEHCNSLNTPTRNKAAATLANMILWNFQEAKNFSRMKLQCTFAISKLVGDDTKSDFDLLNKSLDAVSKYLEKVNIKTDKGQIAPFKIDMPDLKKRLNGVIHDSVQMRQYEHDQEMTVELYHQISKGNLDSPDLRIVWLDNIAKYHSRGQHWEECAQTYVLMAALVSKYLHETRGFPVDIPLSEWKHVFPLIERESTMPPSEMLHAVKEEICLGKEFTPEGYENILRQAVDILRKASLFEECIEVYQMVLPLFRAQANYQRQAVVYADLKDLCIMVVKEGANNTRVAPNYYRVAFIGKDFGVSNGKEYIYKENNFTRIAEFTERVKKQFEDKFTVEIVPNTKELKSADLSSGKNFIQLGAVLPYIEESEDKKRAATMLSQHFGISRFVMEVPYTRGGKAQGEIAEQWKRRVIFTVDGAFPSIKKRAPIVNKSENQVPPIRVAQELISDKIVAIETELNKANTKTLQILLQGSLLACVNVGPLEICRVFLLGERTKLDPVPDVADVQKLANTMSLFIRKLGFALALNKQIAPDQVELQVELDRKYAEFKDLMGRSGFASGSAPSPVPEDD
eukprot:m51a1_g5508 putative DOCK (Dedicator of cytokinesis) protein (1848) ;mRNA; f:378177-385230